MRKSFLWFPTRNKIMIIVGSVPALMAFAGINATTFFTTSRLLPPAMATCTWTGLQSTDWNVANNWLLGNVPTAADNVNIGVVVTGNYPVISNSDAVANSVTIDAGATLTMQGNYNLTISAGGSFTNSGSFNASAATGAVVFAGAGNIDGVTSFKNITINGAVDFGTSSTITGTLLLNAGGTASGASTHLVNYTSSSLLTYNATVATANEWYQGSFGTTTPGAGVPQNVTILSGTITIPNAGGSNRALAGNLFISAGATLQMTAGSRDLYIAGNWTNNGTFNANARKVIMDGAVGVTQTVSGNTTFYDLTLNNIGATTDFGTSVITINHEFRGTNGTMNGNTSTFIFTGIPSGGYIEGPRSKYFYNLQINSGVSVSDLTASAGDIHVSSSFVNNGTFNQHASHTTYFDKTNATENFSGAGNTTFGKLVIGDNGFSFPTTLNCTANFTIAGGSLVFYKNSIYNGINNTATFSFNAVTITGTGAANFYNAITNVQLNPGSGISVFNNNLQLNTGGSLVTNAPVYGTGATLTYNTTNAAFATGIEWTNNTASAGTGAPFNVTIQNTNNVVLAGSRTVPGILTMGVSNTHELDLNGFLLTVYKGFAGTSLGTLSGSLSSGLVIGAGNNAGTVYFTPGVATSQLKTLTLNSGSSLTLGNELSIAGNNSGTGYGILTANGTLNTGGFLTLLSDVNGTAQVGPSYGNIFGEVTVQRYFPAVRAWRFIGIPFSSTNQTIKAAWQEGYTDVVLQCPPQYTGTPGYGTAIAFNNNNGYDIHNNDYKTSMQVHQNNMWVTPPSTTTNLVTTPASPAPAYSLFVRGDRSVCLTTTAPPNITTLRPRGVLNQINSGAPLAMNFGSDVPNGYIFVGNPYAATVDMQNVLATGTGIVNNRFLVWDPKLGYPVGTGGYVTYSNGVWDEPTSPLAVAGTRIQSGQAFFVQRNSSGDPATLTFNETDKNTTYQDVNVFGLQAAGPSRVPAVVYTSLLDTSNNLVGGVAAAFGKGHSATVDAADAPKRWNEEIENMAIVRDQQTLAIEFRPIPGKTDTIFYRLYLRQKPYKLRLYARTLPANLPGQAWLVDKYLGTQTEVKLYDTSFYTFTPNRDTNSYRNRFMLVFNRNRRDRPAGLDSLVNTIKARIYPNPLVGKTFNLMLENAKDGDYTVNILAANGNVVATKKISYKAASTDVCRISVPATMQSGLYVIEIITPGRISVSSLPLVIAR